MVNELKKQSEVESKTSITILYESHGFHYQKIIREYLTKNRPNIWVLEHPSDSRFRQMLEGEITIEKYMEGLRFSFPEFAKKMYELAREAKVNGAKVFGLENEQVDSTRKTLVSLQGMASRQYEASLAAGDFEEVVYANIDLASSLGAESMLRDKLRAKEIANNIKKGEWKGRIVVDAGIAHTQVEKFLRDELRNTGITVDSIHPLRDVVKNTFSRTSVQVYPPFDELARISAYELVGLKPVSEERKKLLSAQYVVYTELFVYPTTEEDEKSNYNAIKLTNQLDYNECEELFNRLQRESNKKEKFILVEKYIEEKKKK